jgi:alkylation response protein AidB-like acyl-CoA dehydrogenase
LGTAQRAFDKALAYAKSASNLVSHISAFQAMQFKLADMATELEAARLMLYQRGAILGCQ